MTTIFLFDNQAAAATLAASTTASASMGVANLVNPQRSKFHRSTAGTSCTYNVTLPAARGADYLRLLDLNLSTAGQIRVQSWADSLGGSTPGVDITVSPSLYIKNDGTAVRWGEGAWGDGTWGVATATQYNVRNATLVPLGSVRTEKYWRITLTDVAGTYQQCGGLFMGLAFRLTYGIGYGWTMRRESRTPEEEALGGQIYSQPRDGRLLLDARFASLTDVERTNLAIVLQEFFDQRKPFDVWLFAENSNRALTTSAYCTFTSPGMTHGDRNHNVFTFGIKEEL